MTPRWTTWCALTIATAGIITATGLSSTGLPPATTAVTVWSGPAGAMPSAAVAGYRPPTDQGTAQAVGQMSDQPEASRDQPQQSDAPWASVPSASTSGSVESFGGVGSVSDDLLARRQSAELRDAAELRETAAQPCQDDGQSGPRVHVVLVTDNSDAAPVNSQNPVNSQSPVDAGTLTSADTSSSSDGNTSRQVAAQVAAVRQAAGQANEVFAQSAAVHGAHRSVRFVTTDCEIDVMHIAVPGEVLEDFGDTSAYLKNHGLNRADRHYLLFSTAEHYCGIADFRHDDRPGAANVNNTGPAFARVDQNCWHGDQSVAAHELVHLFGGVQPSAPNASQGGHCIGRADRMCVASQPGPQTRGSQPGESATGVAQQANPPQNPSLGQPTVPGSTDLAAGGLAVPEQLLARCAAGQLLDCAGTSYFNPTPQPGSYLATHWNVAQSAFLWQVPPTSPM